MQFNSELIINKLQEEEVEFTRELNKLRKQHDEKVDKLIKQHEEKMKDLIRNFSKDDTIIIPKQEESDMSSLIIENDKAPEDKSNISVIDLEKSLEILCINNTPISVQSTSNLNSYHDLDPDLYDYNGILTYSPSVDTKTVSNILTDFTIIDDDVTSISQASPTRYNALPPRTEPINDNKMPNYQRMSIPELKVEVAKYGIRPSGKETMIRQLEIIWKKIHENVDSNDDGDSIDKSSQDVALETIDENETEDNSEIDDTSDGGDNVSTDISLTEELHKYIKGNRQLFCRILRYEVLEFDQLLNDIKNAGIVCTDRQLQLFLDNKGIIHSSNIKSKQWRKKKKKKNIV